MSRFLQHMSITRYGALRDFELGPFGPGLNVVYGPNEAGKSSAASFVGGVLFGWEEARGVRNTYRPAEGQRSGSLSFADDASGPPALLYRAQEPDGLQGDAGLVSDIDHATYRAMFSLSSDELRALREDSDVADRLLTASSGTESSPAAAYVEVEQRIAALTSRAPDADESIFALVDRLEETRVSLDSARAAAALCKQEDRELVALVSSRATTTARLDEANEELEELHAARARVEALDAQIARQRDDLAALEAEQASFDASLPQPAFTATEEGAIVERLDEFAEAQEKLQRGLDVAKENSASSKAAYEALLEVDADEPPADAGARRTLAVVSTLLTLVFVGAGVPLFVRGLGIRSLSETALGCALVVLACFIAAAALAVMFRPDRRGEQLENRRKDAQWVMLQDKKKLDASMREKAELGDEISAYLASKGLEAANGSIRQARQVIDEAREARVHAAAVEQRLAALSMRADSLRDSLGAAQRERGQLMAGVGFQEDAPLQALDMLVREQSKQRDALVGALADMNLRFGELSERLEAARADSSFDVLKQDYHEAQCRLRDAKRELVKLLLAKRMLDRGISAWESRSQPEVYAEASRLFSTLTDGAWVRVSMSAEGQLRATSADGTLREVRHLSLGTCQQLYLALKVAMLLHADHVGAAIPVLADDILVNFDAARRRGAARVLAQLALKRQVIVFTCHKTTLAALREAAPDLTYLEL